MARRMHQQSTESEKIQIVGTSGDRVERILDPQFRRDCVFPVHVGCFQDQMMHPVVKRLKFSCEKFFPIAVKTPEQTPCAIPDFDIPDSCFGRHFKFQTDPLPPFPGIIIDRIGGIDSLPEMNGRSFGSVSEAAVKTVFGIQPFFRVFKIAVNQIPAAFFCFGSQFSGRIDSVEHHIPHASNIIQPKQIFFQLAGQDFSFSANFHGNAEIPP